MVYIPTEWFNGDTITAEKLNKLEEGVAEVKSEIEIINLGEYSATIQEGNRYIINAAPYPYHPNSSRVKEVIDSGKTIIGFVCDCDKSTIALRYVRYDDKDIIAHQFDTPFIEENSKIFAVAYERFDGSTSEVLFNSTLYAICI